MLRGIFDRIVLVAAILAAGCVPSFIAQYRQRLGGRLDQVLRDLAPFQEIANRSHGGDLGRLIRYHLASLDTTFHDEGIAIQAMVDSAERLRFDAKALDADLWHQVAHLARHGDHDIARSTWDAFVPAFSFTTEYVLFSLAAGIAIWIVFLGAWILFAQLGALRGPGHSKGHKVRTPPPRPS